MVLDEFDEFFRRITKRFFKDFEDIEKEFEQFRGLIKPQGWVVKMPGGYVRGGGFSISIHSDGNEPPKIEIRRFGPSGKWEKMPLEKEKMVAVPERLEKKPVKIPAPASEKVVPRLKERMIPEYNVSVDVNEVTITMNAEGVESESDVKLRFYPGSVEIYALVPKLEREYFCTVALPASIDKRGSRIKVEKGRVIISIPRKIQTL